MFQKQLGLALSLMACMILLAEVGISSYDVLPLRGKRKQSSRPNRGCDPAAADNSNPSSMNKSRQPTWLVASAAVNHLTDNQNILTGYKPMPGHQIVHVPHMGPMKVHGSGSVNTLNVVLQDVWYVPGLEMNLVSAGQLTKLGYKVSFGSYGCRISKGSDDNVIGKARFTDEFQFEIEFVKVPPAE